MRCAHCGSEQTGPYCTQCGECVVRKVSGFRMFLRILSILFSPILVFGVLGLIVELTDKTANSEDKMIVLGFVAFLFVIWFLLFRAGDYPTTAESKILKEKAKVDTAKNRERLNKMREVQEEQNRKDHNPVSAVLISSTAKTITTKSALNATGRAVVGSMLAGPAGAIIGAATTKSKTKSTEQSATFSVKYESGRTGTETVRIGSQRFNELASLLHEN